MNLRLPLLGLCLLTASSACSHAHRPTSTSPTPVTSTSIDDPAPQGRPLRVPVLTLWHHGPMGSPYYDVGADVPEFVLYEDGLVVYVDGEGPQASARQARLSSDEVYALLDHAQAQLTAVPVDIVVSRGTDQPAAGITLFHDNRETKIDAYGVDRAGAARDSEASIPGPFVALYRELQDYRHADAEPWQPDELEVVLWRKDELAESVTAWPTAIPRPPADARQPRPFERPGKTTYPRPVVYRVDGEHEAAIDAALTQLGEMTPVEWNGHTWLVRTRRVLPGGPWG